MKLLEKF